MYLKEILCINKVTIPYDTIPYHIIWKLAYLVPLEPSTVNISHSEELALMIQYTTGIQSNLSNGYLTHTVRSQLRESRNHGANGENASE